MNTIGKDLRACLGLRSALEREIDEWRDAIVREIGRSDRELHVIETERGQITEAIERAARRGDDAAVRRLTEYIARIQDRRARLVADRARYGVLLLKMDTHARAARAALSSDRCARLRARLFGPPPPPPPPYDYRDFIVASSVDRRGDSVPESAPLPVRPCVPLADRTRDRPVAEPGGAAPPADKTASGDARKNMDAANRSFISL